MTDRPFTGALVPGTKLGKYEVQEQLAVGGMAIVYKAFDPTLARYVAIKQIGPHLVQDQRFVERFRTEAQTLARLSSSQANIVSVYELVERDGGLFLVMEYVEGTTLRALMDRGPVPLQTGLGILLSTVLGLKAMHDQGIVHRDLTPSNIMRAKDGALKISDFGLIGHAGGRTSLPMGTTKYMAPEMFTGAPVSPRADLYSLGFIAYEMFLGPEKFGEVFGDVLRDERAQQVRWMHWHANPGLKAPPLKDAQPGIPPLIAKIVERMMEKDASRRFASADQVVRWLRRIFVMTVKGQSLSVADSENLEKEMEADAAAASVQALAPRSAAAAQPAAAAAPLVPAGEKTAALPQPKWTWQRAAKWAAIIAGPLLAIAIGLLIWDHYRWEGIKERARGHMEKAKGLYAERKFLEAAYEFEKVRDDEQFAKLREILEYADWGAKQARAEAALKERKWAEADAYLQQATQVRSDPRWESGFQQRLTEARDILQRWAEAENAAKTGGYKGGIDILRDLLARYGPELLMQHGLDAGQRIAELQYEEDTQQFHDLLNRGKVLLAKNDPTGALDAFTRAMRIRETPELNDLIREVKDQQRAGEYYQKAEQAVAAKKWDEAEDAYTRYLQIRPSETVQTKLTNVRAERLAEKARSLDQAGLADQALPIWSQVVAIKPDHPEALARLRAAQGAALLRSHIKAGDEAMARKEYEEAIRSYEDALKLIGTSDAAEKARLQQQVAEAKHQMPLAKARRHIDAKELDVAEQLLLEAKSVKDTPEVNAELQRVAKLRLYYLHLDTAKSLIKEAKYIPALKELDLVQKVWDTPEVRELIVHCNYMRYLLQGKQYLDQNELDKARFFFKLAQKEKDTEEIKGWIKEAERLQTEGTK